MVGVAVFAEDINEADARHVFDGKLYIDRNGDGLDEVPLQHYIESRNPQELSNRVAKSLLSGVNFINILRASFCTKVLCAAFL